MSRSHLGADDYVGRLYLRLALLRARIDRLGYRHVRTLTASEDATTEFRCITVNALTCAAWDAEPVLIFHRGGRYWALQEGCPHANISLKASDIEDFRPQFPTTRGPCLACPAHSYVFDVGSGDCLTNRQTPPARTYDVRVSSAAAGLPGTTAGTAVHVWVCQAPKPSSAARTEQAGLEVGNAIQLKLVEAALRRKFGDGDT